MVKSIVTKEDYFNKKGVDLDEELSSVLSIDDPANVSSYFIADLEDHVIEFLTANYRWDGVFATPFQKQKFKEGIIEQIDYILMCGSMWIEKHDTPMTRDELLRIQISINSTAKFRNGGMMNII